MSTLNKKISDTNVRIGEVRFSYVNVFNRRRTTDGSQGKYQVCVIVPKNDTEIVNIVNEAFKAAKDLGASTKWGGTIPPMLRNKTTILRDGDVEKPDDPAFKGCYFFNASSNNQPGIRVKDNGVVCEALDESELYSGCYGAVTINFYPYSVSGNSGVAAGLQNIIKLRDGERLSGGRSADADFSDL